LNGPPELIVYSRRGCHLCEALLAELETMIRGRAQIRVRDVDLDPEWRSSYGERVPVVCFDGEEVCELRLDRGAVLGIITPDTV
jgi:hypothetical protein